MKKSLILISVILLTAVLALAVDVTGTWNIQGTVAGAPQKLILSTNGAVVINGTVDGVAVTHGGYNGADVWFTAVRNTVTYQYKGSYSGNTLTLRESAAGTEKTDTYTRAGA